MPIFTNCWSHLGEEDKVKDALGNLPFDVRTSLMSRDDVIYYDVTQGPGDVIFVPSGWHHQVHNLVRLRCCFKPAVYSSLNVLSSS